MKFQYVRLRCHLFLQYNEVYDYWSENINEGTIFTREDRDCAGQRLKDGFWVKAPISK